MSHMRFRLKVSGVFGTVGGLLGAGIGALAAVMPESMYSQKGYLVHFAQTVADLGCEYLYDAKTMTKEHRFDVKCLDPYTLRTKIFPLADERFTDSPEYCGSACSWGLNSSYVFYGLAAGFTLLAIGGFVLTYVAEAVHEAERQREMDALRERSARNNNRINERSASFFQSASSQPSSPPKYSIEDESYWRAKKR